MLSLIPSQANPALFCLAGALAYDTAKSSVQLGQQALKGEQAAVVFDCQSVTRIDTAGIAVLLAWLRYAKAQQCALSFQHLPNQAQALLKSSGLIALIPLA